ncbi:MAG: endonuclease/exonuclease/phosphatase family protein [Prevotella sp.]|nr:endonuclease/exonuclease/phosphatase family protein [Candidatus Prevotella equi]
MKKRRIPIYLLAVINSIAVLALWMTGFAYYLNPTIFGWLSMAGYAFPMALLCVIAFFVVWILIKKRYLVISFIGLLVAYVPVTLYWPVNRAQEVPDDTFEVMSYNTKYWALEDKDVCWDEQGMNIIMKNIAASGADIVCLQESNPYDGRVKEELQEFFNPTYQYIDTLNGRGGSVCAILSKYPVKAKELIDIETSGNIVGAFWLDINGRDVIIINCHLQTMGLSISDREKFSDMMHGNQETDTMRHTSHVVFSKILEATKLRTSQAQMVASFIRMHQNMPMIVCGDFNDIPQSYVRYTIGKGLTDCYRATASGPGYSFSHYGMRVRIDNMLCSPDITPYNCYVEDIQTGSDHYPIRCRFAITKPQSVKP